MERYTRADIHAGGTYIQRDTYTDKYIHKKTYSYIGEIYTFRDIYMKRHPHGGTHIQTQIYTEWTHTKGHTQEGIYTRRDIHMERHINESNIYIKGYRYGRIYTRQDIHTGKIYT